MSPLHSKRNNKNGYKLMLDALHREPEKRWQYICDHKTGKSWWILITLHFWKQEWIPSASKLFIRLLYLWRSCAMCVVCTAASHKTIKQTSSATVSTNFLLFSRFQCLSGNCEPVTTFLLWKNWLKVMKVNRTFIDLPGEHFEHTLWLLICCLCTW